MLASTVQFSSNHRHQSRTQSTSAEKQPTPPDRSTHRNQPAEATNPQPGAVASGPNSVPRTIHHHPRPPVPTPPTTSAGRSCTRTPEGDDTSAADVPPMSNHPTHIRRRPGPGQPHHHPERRRPAARSSLERR